MSLRDDIGIGSPGKDAPPFQLISANIEHLAKVVCDGHGCVKLFTLVVSTHSSIIDCRCLPLSFKVETLGFFFCSMYVSHTIPMYVLFIISTFYSIPTTATALRSNQPGLLHSAPPLFSHELKPPSILVRSPPIHEAFSADGWRVRYIRVAGLLPVQIAAANCIGFYTQLSAQFQHMMNTGRPSPTNSGFQARIGDVQVSFLTTTGKLTWDFMNEVILELLESTRQGWVTMFKSEWYHAVQRQFVYVTLSIGGKEIIPGPLKE